MQVFNLTNPQAVFKELESPLKHQTRCITIFPDAEGYLLGSIEGRVAVQHVEEVSFLSKLFLLVFFTSGTLPSNY